ncbi:MAG: hypothetical protein JXX28_16570 [Deltaproteobacteria bacterium]|nr:hypothetical protein [Deltaproteobacteria bacterium]
MRHTLIFSLLALTACSRGGATKSTCDVTVDTLDGTQWAMLEAMPDKTDRENPKARMRWFKEDGKLKVKYTAASLGDVYTYTCELKGEGADVEARCAEQARIRDWCQALEVNKKGSCTPERLAELGQVQQTPAEVEALIVDGKAWVDKYRGTEDWNKVVLNNNNLGNKLQGLLYAKVDARRCRLRISDMYMTIYDGQQKVDSNPVGTNPFVKLEGDWLWDHCDDGFKLVEFEEPQPPADLSEILPPNQRFHPCGGDVDASGQCVDAKSRLYYHYLGDTAAQVEEGCSYTFDVYAGWQPVGKDVQVGQVDGKLDWTWQQEWNDVSLQPGVGVLSMVRYKTCGGAKEKIDTLCNAAKFR